MHRSIHSAIRCQEKGRQTRGHSCLLSQGFQGSDSENTGSGSEGLQHAEPEDVTVCEDVHIHSHHEVDQGDRALSSAAIALEKGFLDEAARLLEESRNHFFIAAKVSLSACKEEYRAVLEHGLKGLDGHAMGSQAIFRWFLMSIALPRTTSPTGCGMGARNLGSGYD
eukprot:CAMPEP_0184304482 /NCGR_PEP_ID=MMETSP1049-20130417/13990_1 /TAXON_ID=77928 /ORGANISM="Proteomonas sulcata, Strain CCMP704" /LENGTH=166 /DNA_ID=CAMNT_0026616297 /DNA_START=589 /DNA_END=1090 /DNA_ORIENTATION=+